LEHANNVQEQAKKILKLAQSLNILSIRIGKVVNGYKLLLKNKFKNQGLIM